MPRAKTTGTAAAKKPRAPKGHKLAVKFPNGELLRDLCKKNWRLGDVIGQGGFGLIYLASDADCAHVGNDAEYVVKIEPISNGPLFCELHFYQKVAKQDFITSWLKLKKLRYLGIPRYVASGQHTYNGGSYRFMVMERFSTDLQKVFVDAGKQFSTQTVFALALRLIDALEYLHEHGYIHADVKASNCLLGYNKGKTDPDSIHLVDFGLASKYEPGGVHKPYKEDPKKAHDGTIEFTSIDAHKGVEPSRRGDMEILAYCLLQWMCGTLPWEDNLMNKDYVRDSKIKYMNDIPLLMKKCFPKGGIPGEITSFLTMTKNLKYEEKPNYSKMRDIFVKGLSNLGVKDTWKLSLPVAGAAVKTPKKKTALKRPATDIESNQPAAKKASPRHPAVKAISRPSTPKGTTRPSTPKGTPKLSTPKGTPKPSTPKGATRKKTSTVVKSPLARQIASPASRKITSPAARKITSPAARKITSPAARKITSPAARKITSPAARAKAVGAKALASTSNRITSPNASAPAPKKRKVTRRKHVQVSEMSVQTSPGLKKNT